MRILFSILFFSSILCSKAWAQPRSYPLSWENTAGPLMRTEALGTPYTTTLKLPYIYDFSSKYLQLKNITNGTTVIVTSMRPHGLLTNDAVEISGAIAPVLVAGKKYINRISDYQFQLFDSVTLTTAAATQNTSIITYLRINKIGAIETVRPDTLAFYDNNGGVTITGGSAKNQPSYWTARFDGLNAYGVPYSTSPYAKGPTDSLRSQPFDLSTYTANDSIMMSFQYQIGGFGEIPDPNGDHFSLEFLDNTLQWNLVNDITVTSQSADSFYTVMVNINDPKYFHNAFAYRFTSFGRQSGAYDVWNLDYIYINKKRKATDPLIKDFAVRNGDQTFLKNYTAMPFDHFFNGNNDTTTFVNKPIKTKITNQANYAKPKIVFTAIINQNLDTLAKAFSKVDQVKYLDSTYSDTLTNFTKISPRKPTYVELHHGLKDDRRVDDSLATTIMDMMFNNIISKRTYLYDYYAYDDAEAESGFGSDFSGVEIAYQFVSEKKDTLTHVDFSFTRNKDVSLENFQIYLMVWGDTVTTVLYQQPISIHYPSSINGFQRYELNSPIVIDSAAKFHVGYKKNFPQLLTVGYDRNNDSRTKSFYKESMQWNSMSDPTIDPGSMMIRPVFFNSSNNVPVGIHPSQGDTKNKLLLYPNPASTTIDIVSTDELSNLNYVMYSLYGQIVASGIITSTDHTLPVAQLSSGMYLILCTDTTGKIYSTRFIKE